MKLLSHSLASSIIVPGFLFHRDIISFRCVTYAYHIVQLSWQGYGLASIRN